MTPATPEHAADLAVIHAKCFAPEETWSEAAMAEVLAMPGAFGFLDSRGGLLLARAAAGEAEILTLAVAPKARRLGIGGALVARAMGAMPPMPWFLEVRARNVAAAALYAAAGFTPCGVRRRYYANGDDALVLRYGAQPGGGGSSGP